MPKVHCNITECEYCKKVGITDFICGCDEIEFVDGECITYGPHIDMSSEYQETFWKRLASRKDGHECKRSAIQGKRYEMIGLVWFTDNDDRWGTDKIWFTEQKSGLACIGGKITEENAVKIRKLVDSVCPVADLPVATEEDL